MSNVRFIGLDVHAETIAVAVAEPDGAVRSLGVIPNRYASSLRLRRSTSGGQATELRFDRGDDYFIRKRQ